MGLHLGLQPAARQTARNPAPATCGLGGVCVLENTRCGQPTSEGTPSLLLWGDGHHVGVGLFSDTAVWGSPMLLYGSPINSFVHQERLGWNCFCPWCSA